MTPPPPELPTCVFSSVRFGLSLRSRGERIQPHKLLPDQLIKPAGRPGARAGFLCDGVMCSCTSPGARQGQGGGSQKTVSIQLTMWILLSRRCSLVVSFSSSCETHDTPRCSTTGGRFPACLLFHGNFITARGFHPWRKPTFLSCLTRSFRNMRIISFSLK